MDKSKSTTKKGNKSELFLLDGKPSIAAAFPLSIQHLLAMIIGNVSPAIIIAAGAGLSPEDQAMLVQCSMFAAAIATFIQVFGIWKFGARLPIVMGINFAFVTVIMTINETYGLPAIYGAQIISGIVVIIFGAFIQKIRKYFPPLVAGTTVLTIGISLYPVAVQYMAGNPALGPENFGTVKNWAVAMLTALVVFFVDQYGKGYIKVVAMLFGILAGFILSAIFGMVDLSQVAAAKMFDYPRLFPFGIDFNLGATLTMIMMFIVTSVEAIGDVSSTTVGGLDRDATTEEISGNIMGNGLSTIINAFFGGLPTATFSQNCGLVATTKVVAKRVISLTAALVLVAGFIPKFGAFMVSIPYPVIGGATISVFAIITINGIKLITSEPLTARNSAIIGLALSLGIGITQVEGSLQHFPQFVQTFFGGSPVIIATLIAFILNLIVPKKTMEQEEEDRKIVD